MGYETGQAGKVTMKMREAGAAILGDPDLSYSHEERAEAVYIAMVGAKDIRANRRQQYEGGSRKRTKSR